MSVTLPQTTSAATADLPLGNFRTQGGGVIRDARLRYRYSAMPRWGRATGPP